MQYRIIHTRLFRRRITPKISVIFPKNARQSIKDALRFLEHLTKIFSARSTIWNYAVLPKVKFRRGR